MKRLRGALPVVGVTDHPIPFGTTATVALVAGFGAILRSRAAVIGSALFQIGAAVAMLGAVAFVLAREDANNPYAAVVLVFVLPAVMHALAGGVCVAAARR